MGQSGGQGPGTEQFAPGPCHSGVGQGDIGPGTGYIAPGPNHQEYRHFIEGEDVSDRIQELPLNRATKNGMNDNTEYELNLSLVGKGHGQTESPLPIDPVPEDIIPDSDADEEGNGQDE